MKSLLIIFSFLLATEIPRKLKEIDRKKKIVSLYGHNPNRNALEDLIKWFLKNDFNFISTENLIQVVKKDIQIKRPVCLSFDDGWRANLTSIFPILKKYKIPATFFISTRSIETGTFWWTKAKRNIHQLDKKIYNSLWEIPNIERNKILAQIHEDIKIRESLTIDELQLLSASKYITIGNHTDHHVNCSNCSRHELKQEIENSNNKIKNWTGISTKYFSYPGGRRNRNTIKLVKQLGFQLAMSTEPKLATSLDDIHDFPRTFIKNSPVSKIENRLMALGIRQKYLNFLKKTNKRYLSSRYANKK